MALKLFEKIEDLKEEELHPKFLLLRDQKMLCEQRSILLEWTEGFIDRDKKIIKEFQTTFHSSLWEFFLHAFFREAGFSVDQSHDRPDFMIINPQPINVEAVISSIKVTGRPESDRNIEDMLSSLTPPFLQDDFESYLNESIIRHSNAINAKHIKHIKGYSKCSWIKEDEPFVIALGSYDQVNYGREFYYPLLALLYGYYFDSKSNSFEKRNYVIKSDTDSKIPLGLFLDPNFGNISAIIFSCTVTFGKLTSLAISKGGIASSNTQIVLNIRHDSEFPHFRLQQVSAENPEYLSDGVFIFHNPNARRKIPLEVFAKTNAVQISYEKGKLQFEGSNLPIFLRMDVSKILYSGMLDVLVEDALIKFNRLND